MKSLENKIFFGITATDVMRRRDHWKRQIEEVKKLKIKSVAIFPTSLDLSGRQEMYQMLEWAGILSIPLVHVREEDFSLQELDYLKKRFNVKWFNGHEYGSKNFFQQFPRYRSQFLIELNYDNDIQIDIPIDKIGGFCIDLSHLKSAIARGAIEHKYVLQKIGRNLIKANHLNGYSVKLKRDMHFINKLSELDYLQDLPTGVFSNVIGLEMENTILEQIKFKKYIIKLLNNASNQIATLSLGSSSQ